MAPLSTARFLQGRLLTAEPGRSLVGEPCELANAEPETHPNRTPPPGQSGRPPVRPAGAQRTGASLKLTSPRTCEPKTSSSTSSRVSASTIWSASQGDRSFREADTTVRRRLEEGNQKSGRFPKRHNAPKPSVRQFSKTHGRRSSQNGKPASTPSSRRPRASQAGSGRGKAIPRASQAGSSRQGRATASSPVLIAECQCVRFRYRKKRQANLAHSAAGAACHRHHPRERYLADANYWMTADPFGVRLSGR